MEQWRKDARKETIIIDIDSLVPADHLLRKIEKVMDYEWVYERLDPYYCHNNGRPGTDPVVLIKMVLIQHLFGIPSLRQTHREIQVNLAYRWFLGYGLLDDIPHFATVSYAFCKRFPDELTSEIFEHILNKALNNRMVDPSTIFIDGTHIKASANKKKYQKEQVKKAAKVYSGQLRREVNAEREKLGKKPVDDDHDDDEPAPSGGGGTTEKTVSTTDPDSGMFVKGEHERQFAYEAHTACDSRGFVLGVEVTAGNIHDSVAWDKIYDNVTHRHNVQFVTMDAGYKTPWIAKKILDDGIVMPTNAPETMGVIYRLQLSQLYPHPQNPFSIRDDQAMLDLIQSVQSHGVLVPAIARPRPDGEYEIIAGHRRKHASELAGLDFMPVVVLDLNDDEAIIQLVDSNIQRENGGIFTMIQNLSNNVILPIAGAILAIFVTLELIQLITDKNNLNDVDTWMFFKWVFKSACAVLIVSNTWNIVMGIFDATQSVVGSAAGLVAGNTSINISSVVTDLEARLEAMELGPLFGLWFQSLFVGICTWSITICIFIVIYGRMIEIYRASRSTACHPHAVRGHFGNPALASR